MKNPTKQILALATTLMLATIIAIHKAHADINLVLPFYTKHIQYKDKQDYTENFANTSLGIEYTNENIDLGIINVWKNSFAKHSIYSYALLYPKPTTIQIGGGLMLAAGGYKTTPLLGAPVLAIKYKWLRIITTAPMAKIANQNFDLLNIQLSIPLGH